MARLAVALARLLALALEAAPLLRLPLPLKLPLLWLPLAS